MTTDQQVSTQAQPVESQSQNSFTIPDAYKDRGYVEKIKSPDDLWKTLDNAQSLLGKRPAGIPANDAPQEEWDKFYQAAGRPDAPDKYSLTDPEGLPEGLDLTESKKSAMQMMHEAGLTQRQAEALWKKYVGSSLEGANKSKAEQDAQFDKITKEHFGGDFETAQKAAIEMAGKFVPAELRGSFADLPPAAMAAVAALSKGAAAEIERVKKEYGVEGKITSGDQAAQTDIMATRKELAALRTSPEARDFLHPKHKETMARITELGGIVDRHFKK